MGTLLYSARLQTYKDCQKISKCQRDPDCPSLSPSARNWPSLLGPRRTRNSQDQRLSSASGHTSRKTNSRTLTTSSSSHRTPRWSLSLGRRRFVLLHGEAPEAPPDKLDTEDNDLPLSTNTDNMTSINNFQ